MQVILTLVDPIYYPMGINAKLCSCSLEKMEKEKKKKLLTSFDRFVKGNNWDFPTFLFVMGNGEITLEKTLVLF